MFQDLIRKRFSLSMRLVIMLVLAVAAFSLMPALVARADDFTVNDNGDGGDANPGDGTCATAGNVCTLRAAIEEANALGGYNTISFSITDPITLASELGITSDLTINGPGAGSLAISGNNATRVINISSGATVTITGVTIQDGYLPDANGAGINNSGTLLLDSARVVNNAISASATEGFGGGVYNVGVLMVSNSTVATNTANRRGGGLYSAGAMTVTDSLIAGNQANFGGGIYNIDGDGSIINCTVYNNRAVEGSGGGIAHNTATAAATLTIRDSTVMSNTARNSAPTSGCGGGLRNLGANGYAATLRLINSTVSGNAADVDGGGIYNERLDSTFAVSHIVNSTVATNTAGSDGGGVSVEVATALLITNTIIADNADAGTDYPDIDINGTLTSGGYNLVGNRGNESTIPSATGDQVGTSANPIDARLGPLADNGGDTWTHALLAGSPALDAIPEGANNYNGSPAVDQRGVARPQGAHADIGAYEAEAELLVVKAVDDATPDPGQRVTYTVTVENGGALTATNVFVSDPLPAGLTFVAGSIALDPAGAGVQGTTPPTLAHGVTITPGHRITVTMAVTVNTGLAGGTDILNTAAVTATEVLTPETASVGLTVNNVAPVAADDSVTTDEDDPPLAISVLSNDSDDNGDTLFISALGVPITGSAAISGTTQVIYTPTNLLAGYADVFTYTVSDGSLTDTAKVTVTVTADNDPPLFVSTPITTATEAVLYTYDVAADDVDEDDVLTITAPVSPTWLTLTDHGDGTATLSGTPGSADVGDHAVVLQVEDTGGLTDTQSFTITVAYVNDAPFFFSTPITTATQGLPYTYTITADDDDLIHGDELTITAPTKPDWLTFTQTGETTATLSGTPTNADVGDHAVELQVEDTGGLTATQSFTITVENVNDPPEFTSTPITAATQDVPYTYNITADDDDVIHGDTLVITATTKPGWLTLMDNGDGTATLSGTPLNAAVGDHAVVLQVEDTGGLTDTQSFTITVANVNDPPKFTSTPVEDATQDVLYTYTVTADDPDLIHGDELTITAPTKPDWLTFTQTGEMTATLTGTPTNDDVGDHAVLLQVTDSGGLTDTQSFTITVADVNDPPVANDDSYSTLVNTPLNVPAPGVLGNDSDPDGDPLTAVLDEDVAAGALALESDGSFIYTPTVDFTGLVTFTYHANDGALDSNVAVVTITVTPLVYPSLSVIKTVEGEGGATSDLPLGGVVTYTIVLSNAGAGAATGVTMTDPLPDGVSFGEWLDQGSAILLPPDDDVVAWGPWDIPADTAYTIRFTAIVTTEGSFAGNQVVNTAYFDSVNAGSGADNAVFTIGVPALSVSKDVEGAGGSTSDLPLGGVVTYTLVIANSGDSMATGVVVTDPLPSGVSFGGWLDQGSALLPPPDNDTVEWGVWNVPEQSEYTIRFTATITSSAAFAGETVTNTVYYVSENAGAGADDAVFTISAVVNRAPFFTSTPVEDAVEDVEYIYAITAEDLDVGDELTITGPTVPTWLTLEDHGDGSATLSGTPGSADVGEHPVLLQVEDTGGLTDTQSFTITVFAAGENTPPTISVIANQRTTVNTPLGPIPFTIGDAETAADDLILSRETSDGVLIPLANIVLGGSGTERNVTITPAAGLTGTATITITVTDEGGLSRSRAFQVMVEPFTIYLPLVARNAG